MEDRIAAAIRLMRVLKMAFLLFGLLLIFVIYRVPAKPWVRANPALEVILMIVAGICVAEGFLAPRFFGRLLKRRQGADPLQAWLAVGVLSLAFFNAAMLFGCVVHFTGGRLPFEAVPLLAGWLSILVWRPQAAPAGDVPAV